MTTVSCLSDSGLEFATLKQIEKRVIVGYLAEARGNQRRAADLLGITRWAMRRKIKKYGIQLKVQVA